MSLFERAECFASAPKKDLLALREKLVEVYNTDFSKAEKSPFRELEKAMPNSTLFEFITPDGAPIGYVEIYLEAEELSLFVFYNNHALSWAENSSVYNTVIDFLEAMPTNDEHYSGRLGYYTEYDVNNPDSIINYGYLLGEEQKTIGVSWRRLGYVWY